MEKIRKLRKLLNKHNLDGYLIGKNDEYFEEYIAQNNERLKFITNFSGSYGFALILKKKLFLFVDGRYSLQAKIQSGKLFNIVTIPKNYPGDILKNKNFTIGYDPKLYTKSMLSNLFKRSKAKLISVDVNLVDKIWKRKLNSISNKFYKLKDNESGQKYQKKIQLLSKIINKRNIDFQFITSSENISWLLNLRSKNSEFTPIIKGYALISKVGKITFFCEKNKINVKLKKKLKNILIIDIKYIDKFLNKLKNKNIQIDVNSCSIYFEKLIEKNNKIIQKKDSIYFIKSIKNKTEVKNIIKSHEYDGAALTKFLIWLKKNFKNKKISEIDAEKKLLKFRKEIKTFKSLSFPTISGAGPNSAIIHYKANKKSNRILKKGELYLVDSGGQYNFGTTDVTRTISLENKQNKIKDIFTRVLKGHIAVSNFQIKKNTCGSDIDLVARKYLKEKGLDYAHGTGHGVGYFSNVHEGPQSISKGSKQRFYEGMVTSNEPGYYKNGKFGIRIENLVLVKRINKLNKFETLTLAPIDKTLINKILLSDEEIKWLDKYHSRVYQTLNKHMNKSEKKDLKNLCSNIQ